MPWSSTGRQSTPQMRVLGTQLPRSQTIHERVLGPAGPGRPLVIKPSPTWLERNKGKKPGYRLLWNIMKPPSLQAAEDRMKPFMPAALTPTVLKVTHAKANRLAR